MAKKDKQETLDIPFMDIFIEDYGCNFDAIRNKLLALSSEANQLAFVLSEGLDENPVGLSSKQRVKADARLGNVNKFLHIPPLWTDKLFDPELIKADGEWEVYHQNIQIYTDLLTLFAETLIEIQKTIGDPQSLKEKLNEEKNVIPHLSLDELIELNCKGNAENFQRCTHGFCKDGYFIGAELYAESTTMTGLSPELKTQLDVWFEKIEKFLNPSSYKKTKRQRSKSHSSDELSFYRSKFHTYTFSLGKVLMEFKERYPNLDDIEMDSLMMQ